MILLFTLIYLVLFGVNQLLAYSPRNGYLAGIKCKITNNNIPQWPNFRSGKTVRLGYFDVASAVDTDFKWGHYQLALAANYKTFHHRYRYVRIIEDIRIVASNGRYTRCPSGYRKNCGWDVDSGVGTDGRSGHWDIALCVRMAVRARGGRQQYVKSVILKASSKSRPPSTPWGYRRIGFWDVEKSSFSNYDRSSGHYMMGMYVQQKRIWVLLVS